MAAAHDAGPIPLRPVDPETDDLAAAAAAQTHGLLDKFRVRPVGHRRARERSPSLPIAAHDVTPPATIPLRRPP